MKSYVKYFPAGFLISLLLCAFFALSSGISFPNENTFEYDPSLTGQIVPRTEGSIIVEKEFMEIRFKEFTMPFASVSNHSGMPALPAVRV